ncbi:MAG: Holliday junction branch migration protein RuvA [Oscillospiraceae bacterium]
MFHHIIGKVSDIELNLAVLDCAGIGFQINTTANTLSHLKIGENAKLYIYENIREDAFDLYGFSDKREKRCFEMLIGVSGVGPKAAISILSSATPEALAMAIISGDEKALTIAPGIGKKIAQRILLELKDKMSKETDGIIIGTSAVSMGTAGGSKLSDAVSALAVLGYSNSEISVALKDIDTETTKLEDVIRAALKKMVK